MLLAELFSAVNDLPWPLIGLVLMVLAFLESAALVGLVIPGETGILAGSAVAGAADAPWPLFVAGVAVAAIAGDVAGYVLGQRYGPRIRCSRLGERIGDQRWARADDLLAAHGPQAVVAARFVPIAQALVPLLAGAAGMTRPRFLRASALGATAWSLLYVNAGFLLGTSAQERGATLAVGAGAVVAVLLAVTLCARRFARRERTVCDLPRTWDNGDDCTQLAA